MAHVQCMGERNAVSIRGFMTLLVTQSRTDYLGKQSANLKTSNITAEAEFKHLKRKSSEFNGKKENVKEILKQNITRVKLQKESLKKKVKDEHKG